MKQILQSLRTGVVEVANVPIPSVSRGSLLIQTKQTLVSVGTERMLVEFGRAGWIQKARQQPEKVRMVIDKVRSDGLYPAIQSVLNKLDQPLPLGYCNVGRVVDIGLGVNGFAVGQRVISNGNHAEFVVAPENLCTKVPDRVSDEEAAFTVLGAIGLQGVRLVQPTLGETVVVLGLGLIGLMTVQILRAHGCRVLALDFDAEKLNLAQKFGAEIVNLTSEQDPLKAAEIFSRGRGVDAVIITATTKSSEPIHQAAMMCRKRGRIVLVGVTGLELSREDFFKKELTFQVSASYGPGRYDVNYEGKGYDYPVGFVRWTAQRNFEAILDMMADKLLDVKPLISHRFHIEQAELAYKLFGGEAPSLGILLEYPGVEISSTGKTVSLFQESVAELNNAVKSKGKVIVGFVGAGNYARAVLMPAFKTAGAYLRSVASSAGVTGLQAARKFRFEDTTTDVSRIFSDNSINAVVITTQHDSHAQLVLQALNKGKHVFVEKPLCLTLDELSEIEAVYSYACNKLKADPILMVGFNRRFAPQIQKIKQLLSGVKGPRSLIMTINAGEISFDHWTQDSKVGGGRIIGEACHFIDLFRFLVGSPIKSWSRSIMDARTRDTVTINLNFVDGSIGTIHYFSNGNKSFPKERLEIFVDGRILRLDNYRKLTAFGWPGFKGMNLWLQNKGQIACVQSFIAAIAESSLSPIPIDELLEVSRLTIEISEFQN